MEIEDQEQEILLEPEGLLIAPVTSVNGQTGDVVLKTSDLENDSNYQNANDLTTAISNHNTSTSAHQDIRQAISDEQTARINADNGLQGQIDAITSASDVVDIVGTYAELEAYDTQHLKDNDVIKVLQDETHNDAMTYYRWSTQTDTWTYIGAEGPYYTKSETNTLLNEKLDVDEVPDGFFDGPATITPTASTSVELQDSIKLKSVNLLGDTEQQTYSGKNLVYTQNGTHTSAGVTWTITDDTIIGSGQVTGSSSNISDGNSYFATPLPAGTYTFSLQEPAPHRIGLYLMSDGGVGDNAVVIQAGGTKATFTTNYTAVYFRIVCGQLTVGEQLDVTYINKLQLEAGNQATAYEPYVGGIPAPNPDYPQNVNVVTGTQTITFSDGDSATETYTVNLGSIELCKIGTYQDYIYKSGDDWYVHKKIGKKIFDGTETWNASATNQTGIYRMATANIAGLFVPPTENSIPITGLSSSFMAIPADSHGTYGAHTGISGAKSGSDIYVYHPDYNTSTSAADFKTWLANNNVTFYYALATPTDTKITDSALIAQLNALLNADIYQPTTTISSSGNLPVILDVEAFTDNLNAILEIASEPAPEPVTYDDFTGTDGVTAGTHGLVPAPATTDAGKFLKSDGTWDTAGGSTINVVQTTGNSQTDVMSQKAVTDTIFYNNNTAQVKISGVSGFSVGANSVTIGTGSAAQSNRSIAIGANAVGASSHCISVGMGTATGSGALNLGGHNNSNNGALAKGSIALGFGAVSNTQGEMNIGADDSSYGYSNTNYRLISGVYDGQNAHDAVTVGQLNATITAINTALGTNIPPVGA